MMARVCTTVTEWIYTNVSKPIEVWEEGLRKSCKKRPWYDPRRWLCTILRVLVLVIRWVVVTVVTAVFTVVCHLTSDILSAIWSALQFVGHLLKALFTWDKCALQEALAHLGDAVVGLVGQLIGDVLIRPIIDRIQTYRLRRYVKHEIAQRFSLVSPDSVSRMWDRFNVDYGVFGYRLTCKVHRMYVDSQTLTERFGDVPNLFALHDAGLINLYQLAGFDEDCSVFSKQGWYRPRHEALTYPDAPTPGSPPRLTRDQLTTYIESRGTAGPHFRIYAISPSNLNSRCTAGEEVGRQVGLILDFDREEIEVTDDRYINYHPGVQSDFLIKELGRKDKRVDPGGVRDDLCSPVAVAVFGFADRTLRGVADNPIGTTWCVPGRNLTADDDSGVSFIDDIPDFMRRYVLIHELGHYFGLCHVDGFDRVMVSGNSTQGSILTWGAPFNFFLHGGPRFIHNEGKRVWDFILTNFSLSCLDPDGGGVIL